MGTLKMVAIAAAAWLAGTGFADAQEQQRPARRTPDEVLKSADKDGDGKLSKDEFMRDGHEQLLRATPQGVSRTARIDTNGDGTVSLEEYSASPRVAERWTGLDKDSSGFLERAEVEAMAAERRRGERGGDRGAGGGGSRPRLEEMIKRSDANGDGKVTREEFQGRPEMFDRIDRNQDGALDAADLPPEPPAPPAPPSAPPAPPAPEAPPAPPETPTRGENEPI